jgi:hypothetical protein
VHKPEAVLLASSVELINLKPSASDVTAVRRLWLQAGSSRGTTAAAAAAGSSGQMLQRVVVQSGRVARPASKDRRAEWAVKFKEVPSRNEVGCSVGCQAAAVFSSLK